MLPACTRRKFCGAEEENLRAQFCSSRAVEKEAKYQANSVGLCYALQLMTSADLTIETCIRQDNLQRQWAELGDNLAATVLILRLLHTRLRSSWRLLSLTGIRR